MVESTRYSRKKTLRQDQNQMSTLLYIITQMLSVFSVMKLEKKISQKKKVCEFSFLVLNESKDKHIPDV